MQTLLRYMSHIALEEEEEEEEGDMKILRTLLDFEVPSNSKV